MVLIERNDRRTLYKDAINTFGREKQVIVAIEELSELQKELCKSLRHIGDADNLQEEIADVEIMLEQLRIIYDLSEIEINHWKETKLNRLHRRLYGEQ